jgi:hypothetical protein
MTPISAMSHNLESQKSCCFNGKHSFLNEPFPKLQMSRRARDYDKGCPQLFCVSIGTIYIHDMTDPRVNLRCEEKYREAGMDAAAESEPKDRTANPRNLADAATDPRSSTRSSFTALSISLRDGATRN